MFVLRHVTMISATAPVLAAALLAVAATAGVMAPPATKVMKVAGVVNANGGIISGSGFKVAHNATGNYTISTPDFTRYPAMLVTPTNATGVLANVQSAVCTSSGGCSFIIEFMIGSKAVDSAFSFYATSTTL